MKFTKKQKIYAVLIVVAVVVITLVSIPLIRLISSDDFLVFMQEFVEEAGIWGIFAILLLQALQILLAVIPGEPIEVLAGIMYGTFGGLAICLIGILLASAGIFYTVRKLGKERLEKTKLYPQIMESEILKNQNKLKSVIFILYLIPGTPKDILVYACALTNIKMSEFLFISTLARIPSVVSSTMAGASFMSGNIWLTVTIFVVTALAGVLGIVYQNKRNEKSSKKSGTES